jgi:CxxC motif-containing protein (DUF1111 family)
MRLVTLAALTLVLPSLVVGCNDIGDPAAPAIDRPGLERSSADIVRAAGKPLNGLTGAQRNLFERGKLVFGRVFEPTAGLGPLFNDVSCGSCHGHPAAGGNGEQTEVQAASFSIAGTCDHLPALGGPVIQQLVTPALFAALGIQSEPFPAGAPAAVRTSPDLFGFGLLDAVPDDVILALADPNDENGDGISGRANLTTDGQIGRFGRKAETPTLREFNDKAFLDEMGITTPAFPVEGTVGGISLPAGVDAVADPEIDEDAAAAADAFVRFLAPPRPLRLTMEAKTGQRLFTESGCPSCHVPVLPTGDNPIRALRNKRVAAYTDLLLHDMGPGLADICLGGASPTEFRTEPLMGLRLEISFLHDGRASTVTDAIEAHGGEALVARDRFRGLSSAERAAIVAFLGSL